MIVIALVFYLFGYNNIHKKLRNIISIALLICTFILSIGCSNKNNLDENPQKHDNKVEDVLNAINTPDFLAITETNCRWIWF